MLVDNEKGNSTFLSSLRALNPVLSLHMAWSSGVFTVTAVKLPGRGTTVHAMGVGSKRPRSSLSAATYLKKTMLWNTLLLGAGFTSDLCGFQPHILPQPLPFSCWALNSQSPPLTLLLSECSSVSLIFNVAVLVLGQCLQLPPKEITVVVSLVLLVPTPEASAFP